MDSVETHAYGTSKDLVNEIQCKNIIKRYKKWLTLIMSQKEA